MIKVNGNPQFYHHRVQGIMQQREIVFRRDKERADIVSHHKKPRLFEVEVHVGVYRRIIADFLFFLRLELLRCGFVIWRVVGCKVMGVGAYLDA